MKLRNTVVATLVALSAMAPAAAQDSVERGSAASVGASVLAGASVAWIAYEGSEFTVNAIRAAANGVELSLRNASNGIETSAVVAKSAADAASVAVGTSVKVVAETTGYALMAAGRMIAFVPNEIGRGLVHRSSH